MANFSLTIYFIIMLFVSFGELSLDTETAGNSGSH